MRFQTRFTQDDLLVACDHVMRRGAEGRNVLSRLNNPRMTALEIDASCLVVLQHWKRHKKLHVVLWTTGTVLKHWEIH